MDDKRTRNRTLYCTWTSVCAVRFGLSYPRPGVRLLSWFLCLGLSIFLIFFLCFSFPSLPHTQHTLPLTFLFGFVRCFLRSLMRACTFTTPTHAREHAPSWIFFFPSFSSCFLCCCPQWSFANPFLLGTALLSKSNYNPLTSMIYDDG